MTRTACLLAVTVLWATGHARAQATSRLVFDTRFPEGLGFVSTVRPLSDGHVLLADPLGQMLLLVDLDAQKADTLGHVGAGPREYRNPDAVFPLPADSTLLVDLGNGRLTVIAPNGRFIRSTLIARQTSDGRLTMILPRFVDSQGHLYFQTEDIGAGSGQDSARIARFDRHTGTIDTVAAVRLAGPAKLRGHTGIMLGQAPLAPKDDWAVAPDGRVAVVRANDYSVHWIRPGVETVSGPPTAFRPVPIGRAEKDAWVEEFFTASIDMGIRRSANGERQVRFSRGARDRGDLDIDQVIWPSHLPAFKSGRSVVAPNGDLWVQRYGAVDQPVNIDVFGRHGQKKDEVELPAHRHVVGFGGGAVYVIYVDEVGLHWLERYRIG
jgi:hypothetical protein